MTSRLGGATDPNLMSNSAPSGLASDGRVMSGHEDSTNVRASSEDEATNKGMTAYVVLLNFRFDFCPEIQD